MLYESRVILQALTLGTGMICRGSINLYVIQYERFFVIQALAWIQEAHGQQEAMLELLELDNGTRRKISSIAIACHSRII